MLKTVMFTDGMSNDFMVITTDAPRNKIEDWCHQCNKEQESGENTYFDSLKKNFFVHVIHDSSLSIVDRDSFKYDEIYDLSNY